MLIKHGKFSVCVHMCCGFCPFHSELRRTFSFFIIIFSSVFCFVCTINNNSNNNIYSAIIFREFPFARCWCDEKAFAPISISKRLMWYTIRDIIIDYDTLSWQEMTCFIIKYFFCSYNSFIHTPVDREDLFLFLFFRIATDFPSLAMQMRVL